MGLGAIDQSEKSILNGKIMQHAAKGKDLRTIPKSRNPSLRMQLKKKKKRKYKCVGRQETEKHSESRIQITSGCCCFTRLQLDPQVDGPHLSLAQRGASRSSSTQAGQHRGRDTAGTCHDPRYPQHKHSTHVHSYSRGALLLHPNSPSI